MARSTSPESLDGIGTFVTVVRSGSLAAAARALGVPKSTISRRVSRLEATLGVPLVHRDRRKVALTNEGSRLYDRVASSFDTISFALRAARLSTEQPRGHLRISAPTDFGQLVLPRLLSEFRTIYTEITIEVFLSDRFVDMIQEGFDLAVRAGSPPDTNAAQSLIARKLVSGGHVLVGNADAAARITSLADLEQSPFILFRAPELTQTLHLVDEQGKRHELNVRGSCVVHDYPSMAAFIATGEGVGLLPRIHLEHGSSGLRHLLPELSSVAGDIMLVYPSRQVPRRTTLLIEHLVEGLG